MWSLHQPIHLWVAGLHISSMILLVKLASLSLRNLARALKIEMQPRYRNLVTVLAVWSGSHMPLCSSWNGPGTPGHWQLRQSIQLYGHLYASKVYMQEVHKSSGHNWVGQFALMLQATCTRLNGLLHPIGHAWPPKALPQQGQGMAMSLMTYIPIAPIQAATWWALGTTKSRKSSVSPLGVECRDKAPWWIMKFCWFVRSAGLLHWNCVLPEVPSNLSSAPSASPTLCPTLGLFSGLQPN